MTIRHLLVVMLMCCPVIAGAQQTIGDLPLPAGYTRVQCDGYGNFLRKIKLTGDRTVHTFDGLIINYQNAYAVLDIDVGDKDLQQCADAAMRLWAEYLYGIKAYNRIYFTALGSGKPLRFSTWAQRHKSYSYATFRKYLDNVFTYCNSTSMGKEMKPVAPKDLKVGDCFVYVNERFYGHVVTVVDMAVNAKGEKIFMVAQ
ncbi:MAG: hypothetical protein IKX93_03785, partial [Bacteroidaceae bacterium]|nr:hypothetical protein [Bacteroidaceae bacterium]